jgi:hypothetical protein
VRTCWWLDIDERVRFGRWLYNRRLMFYGTDMLSYFEDPLGWIESRLMGDLRKEYEQEMGE